MNDNRNTSPNLHFPLSHHPHRLPPFSHSTFPQISVLQSNSHSSYLQNFRPSIAMAALSTVVGAQPAVKVVALCGSLRRNSSNRGLIRAATEIAKESIEGLEIEYVDISPLPMLNTDLEVDGTYPPVVEAFRRKILEADSVLFASPEYNYSVTAPLKNALDWASRPPNVWGDKAAAVVSSSGGSGGARSQYHLRQIGVFLDLHFINKPEFFLNAYQPPPKFDSNGDLIDGDIREKLKAVLLALRAFSLRLRGTSVIN